MTIVCVLIDSFTFFFLMLWLLAIKSTKYIGKEKKEKTITKKNPKNKQTETKTKNKKKQEKTRNFDRGKCLGSPHNGYGPAVARDK